MTIGREEILDTVAVITEKQMENADDDWEARGVDPEAMNWICQNSTAPVFFAVLAGEVSVYGALIAAFYRGAELGWGLRERNL